MATARHAILRFHPSPRIPKNDSSNCQVDGCSEDLGTLKEYFRRHKVCLVHSKASHVLINNVDHRFCQQCSRFHTLDRFDDWRRSCRSRLQGHNSRRRKSENGGSLYDNLDRRHHVQDGFIIEDEGIRVKNLNSDNKRQPSATPSNGNLLLSLKTAYEASNRQVQAGISSSQNRGQSNVDKAMLSEAELSVLLPHNPNQQQPTQAAHSPSHMSTLLFQASRLQPGASGNACNLPGAMDDSAVKTNGEIELVKDFHDVEGAPRFRNMHDSCSSHPSQNESEGSERESWQIVEHRSAETDKSLADSDKAPKAAWSYPSQETTWHFSIRWFGAEADGFPQDVDNHIVDWLGCPVSGFESFSRGSQNCLTFVFRVPLDNWKQILKDPKSSIERFVYLYSNDHWKKGSFLFKLESTAVFVRDGVVYDFADSSLRSLPSISLISPICFVAGDMTPFQLVGSVINEPDSHVIFTKYRESETRPSLPIIDGGDFSNRAQKLGSSASCDDSSPCSRYFVEVENVADSGMSNPWPVLVADVDITNEIRSLESEFTARDAHELVDLRRFIHDIGWAFEEIRRLSSVTSPEYRIDGFTQLPSERAQKRFKFDGSSYDSRAMTIPSIEGLISCCVAKGWWATSRLLLDLAVAKKKSLSR